MVNLESGTSRSRAVACKLGKKLKFVNECLEKVNRSMTEKVNNRMNIEKVDKEILKSVITEVLIENPNYFKEILTEILSENSIIKSNVNNNRSSRLKEMIQEDFDKYGEVFKSLA
jgi:Tfp pilus assembly pilus retraction ATPase PilT